MVKFLTQYWWVLVLRGVLAIIVGIAAFAMPLATVAALVMAFGIVAIIDGIFAIGAAIDGRKLPYWWVSLLQGLLGIGIGVLTLTKPAVTAVALLIYIAIWAIGMGVLQLIAAVNLRKEITGEFWVALGGLAGIAFGVLIIRHPGEGALAVIGTIGVFALIWGALLLFGGFDMLRLRNKAA
jgi:uncharacterized membrane protein HdeD (DUF308 family)